MLLAMKNVIASIVLVSFACGMASACAVKSNPAQTKVYTPYGEYRYHCPPGHRKKGECF